MAAPNTQQEGEEHTMSDNEAGSLGEGAFPSSEIFATALFGARIYGRAVVEGDDNAKEAQSWADCMGQIVAVMTPYGYAPTTLTNKRNLQAIRKGAGTADGKGEEVAEDLSNFAKGHDPQDRRAGRTAYIYCERCMNDCKSADNFYAEVIAIVKFQWSNEPGQPKRVSAEVVAVYPHCHECNVLWQRRRNYQMDQQFGGPGYLMIDLPIEELVGETYNGFVNQLVGINKGGEHHGTSLKHIPFPLLISSVFSCRQSFLRLQA